MKRLYLIYCFLLFAFSSKAQEDYSGVYYSKMRPIAMTGVNGGLMKPGKEDFGYLHDLVLMKISGNRYKFWLYVCKGFPSYNSGSINGYLSFERKKAVFLNNDSTEENCRLIFILEKSGIYINHDYGFGGCGFGANVTAEGNYPLKRKKVTNKDINSTYQEDIDDVIVTSEKAFIYKNESDSLPTKQYFVKGDKIPVYDESDTKIYTDYISPTGKLISGWIHKKDLGL